MFYWVTGMQTGRVRGTLFRSMFRNKSLPVDLGCVTFQITFLSHRSLRTFSAEVFDLTVDYRVLFQVRDEAG